MEGHEIWEELKAEAEAETARRQAQLLDHGERLEQFFDSLDSEQLEAVCSLLAGAEANPVTASYYRGVARGLLHAKYGVEMWGLVKLDFDSLVK